MISNRCIPPTTGYLVTVSFDGITLDVNVLPDVTSINMSDYFTGLPLANTLYTISVTVLNDRGGQSDEVSVMHGKLLL